MTDDEELRAALAGRDPAADLPPLSRPEQRRLLEETMSNTRPSSTGGRPERRPGRPGRPGGREPNYNWLIAAAAVVLIAFGVVALVNRGGDDVPTAGEDSSQSAEPTPSQSTEQTSPSREQSTEPTASPEESTGTAKPEDDAVTLKVPAGSGRCAIPRPELLAQQEIAVDATVASITDGEVMLTPTEVFTAGKPVVLRVQQPAEALGPELNLGFQFEEGKRYLISGTDGMLSMCGYSGEYNADLAKLYQQAFGD